MEPENPIEEQEPHKNPEGDPKPEVGGEETSETPEENIEELRKQAEVSKQNFERAKKAEEELKRLKKQGATKNETKQEPRLSDADLLYITKSDIHEEDLSEVREYAEFKGVSIKEAHQKIKPILDARMEERKTAAASQTKSPRGTAQISGDAIISEARKGNLPDDDGGIEALAEAHLSAKKQQKRR